MSGYLERLKEAIRVHSAVIVTGTGISKALSGGAPSADWVGLTQSGVKLVLSLGESQSWGEVQERAIEYAVSEQDSSQLIGVASQVSAKLKAHGDQTYADWLRDEVGELPLTDGSKRLADAIGALRSPILTTNYDTLLEGALGLSSANWMDKEAIRSILRSDSPAIGHLHGVWNKPESVIYSGEDYSEIVSSDPAQFLQQAHYATKSFIFIGYGSGLSDPNFGRMLAWHRKLFPTSGGDHFRLCTDAEVADLTQVHAGDDVRVIAYGSQHSALAGFLESLTPTAFGPAKTNHDGVAYAREAILDQIRSDTVVGEHVPNADECELDEITVAPVLLPMPHEQFAAARSLDSDLKPARVDTRKVVSSAKVLIVAGEELSGVTTAVRWLAANAAQNDPRLAPLYVDARSCSIPSRPLDRQVRREALSHRLIDLKNDPLPPHILAIDNLKSQETKVYRGVLSDLLASSADFIVVGCRQGDDIQLASDLAAHRLPVETVYVGKLAAKEVTALARIIAPAQAKSLCEMVLTVVKREHLPRTPFTVSLLLVLFAQGGKAAPHNSETAVLNEYVSLMLGRNGEYLDPRWALDPQNREVVLGDLAKHFVRERKGSLSQSDAVEFVEQLFVSLDWTEDAMATLESFRVMRLLRISNDVVQFQQSSFLHLFAAKAAMTDDVFLEEILADPVYFAPIVRHYAALVRGSERVVGAVQSLLKRWPVHEPLGSIFGEVQAEPAPQHEDGENDVDMDPSEPTVAPREGATDDYDYSDDTDAVPFPLTDPSTWSRTEQLAWSLDLASRVIRDSDQIANPELKNSALRDVLIGWGFLLELFEEDSVFEQPSELLVDRMLDGKKLRPQRREELVKQVSRMLPSFVVLGGIQACLSSRKLLRAFDRLMNEGGLSGSAYGQAMAALFAFEVQEPGWAAYLPPIARDQGQRWVVSNFLGFLVALAHQYQALTDQDELDARAFLRERADKMYAFSDDAARRRWLATNDQRLTRRRALAKRNRLAPGDKAIDAIPDGAPTASDERVEEDLP